MNYGRGGAARRGAHLTRLRRDAARGDHLRFSYFVILYARGFNIGHFAVPSPTRARIAGRSRLYNVGREGNLATSSLKSRVCHRAILPGTVFSRADRNHPALFGPATNTPSALKSRVHAAFDDSLTTSVTYNFRATYPQLATPEPARI